MNPPIIVIDGDTVDLFSSVASAERYLEVPDIDGLLIFDSDGCRLHAEAIEETISVLGPWTTPRSRVSIGMAEPPVHAPEELRRLLQNHLRTIGRESGEVDESNVIAEAVRTLGFTK